MSLRQLTHDPHVQALILLVPALAIYAVFALYPMLNVVILSFQKWNGLEPKRQFVGIANDQAIFTKDPVCWGACRNTVIWTMMSLIFPP
ncbi:sugar ABC transporter permease, partial [Rhizobium leguminosarum]